MKEWEILACIAWSMLFFGISSAITYDITKSIKTSVGVAVFVATMVFCAWAAFEIGIRQ